jgi:putative salt-induced outer membrane protein YdiY
MKHLGLFVLVVSMAGAVGRAELVVFKNGDQLTGGWERVNGKQMTFKAENLGEVSIPVGKVKSMTSTKQAAILLKNGQAYRGMLSLLDTGEWELKGKDGGVRKLPVSEVVAIYALETFMSKAGESGAARPWDNWTGTGTVGYSLVRGERDAGTLSLGVGAVRRQPDLPGYKERFRTNYLLNVLFANTRTDGIRTSANSFSTSLRQDYLFTPTNFAFVLGQWEHIQTQSLDLRQTYGAGIGRDLLRRPRINMQFLGGLTYVRESFANAELRRNVEALVGEKLALNISKSVSLAHSLNVFPSLTEGGDFRVDSTTSLSTRVTSRLSFNTTFTDRFLSRPLPDRQRNELIFTTGLGLNF